MASLNDAVQYAIRTLKTAGETVRKFYEFTLGDPKDVSFEVYDENGNLIKRTLPNYRKQLQILLRDKKHLPYLDGGIITNEQDLRDFLHNIPLSGIGSAKLQGTITLTRPITLGGGKTCFLSLEDAQIIHKAFVFTNPDGTQEIRMPQFIVESGSYLHLTIRNKTVSPVFVADISGVDPTTIPWSPVKIVRNLFLVVHSQLRVECGQSGLTDPVIFDVSASDQINLLFAARAFTFLNLRQRTNTSGRIKLASSTHQIVHVDWYSGLAFLSTRLIDPNGNDLYTDANGNPIEVDWKNHTTGLRYRAIPADNRILTNVISANKFM